MKRPHFAVLKCGEDDALRIDLLLLLGKLLAFLLYRLEPHHFLSERLVPRRKLGNGFLLLGVLPEETG